MPIERSGGGTSGAVTSVTAADATIVIGGTATAPTVRANGWSASIDTRNTNTAQNLISQSIPGGTLGVTAGVLVTIGGVYQNNSGAARGVTLAILYGGTTMWGDAAGAASFPATANLYPFYMQFVLNTTGATGAQRASGAVMFGNALVGSVAGSGQITGSDIANSAFSGSSSVDSTVAQTLTVQWTNNVAAAQLGLVGVTHITPIQ